MPVPLAVPVPDREGKTDAAMTFVYSDTDIHVLVSNTLHKRTVRHIAENFRFVTSGAVEKSELISTAVA